MNIWEIYQFIQFRANKKNSQGVVIPLTSSISPKAVNIEYFAESGIAWRVPSRRTDAETGVVDTENYGWPEKVRTLWCVTGLSFR